MWTTTWKIEKKSLSPRNIHSKKNVTKHVVCCKEEYGYIESDMLLRGISNEEKETMINYYEYANNPSKYWNKYCKQYHAFELIVFKQHAAETWDDVVDFLKDNQQLQKMYSKNL